MTKLKRDDLMSLEEYHTRRRAYRAEVMAHKAKRKVPLGEHATLYFEDRMTIQYQIQEMLRVERIFEGEAIDEELATYNPLIPDGDNWKATFMLEYADVTERAEALGRLVGVEDRLWVQVGDHPRVWAIADEDLERSRDNKTSAVHFVRYPFTAEMVRDARAGAAIALGVDHPHYREQVGVLGPPVRESLLADLEAP